MQPQSIYFVFPTIEHQYSIPAYDVNFVEFDLLNKIITIFSSVMESCSFHYNDTKSFLAQRDIIFGSPVNLLKWKILPASQNKMYFFNLTRLQCVALNTESTQGANHYLQLQMSGQIYYFNKTHINNLKFSHDGLIKALSTLDKHLHPSANPALLPPERQDHPTKLSQIH